MKKVCIVTTQRSGSTWFVDLLRGAGDVGAYGEVFIDRSRRPDPSKRRAPALIRHQEAGTTSPPLRSDALGRTRDTNRYLRQLHRENRERAALFFKVMYGQLDQRPELLPLLVVNRYRFIHLVRSNVLEQLVSLQRARLTGVFQSADASPSVEVELDASTILGELRRNVALVEQHRRTLRRLPNPSIEITYESLLGDERAQLARLSSFLDVDLEFDETSSRLQRISDRPVAERIENAADIRTALGGSEFDHLLGES
ncbi:MAG: Stf0 family sulfotransferase [Actinomycetota bacterium]